MIDIYFKLSIAVNMLAIAMICWLMETNSYLHMTSEKSKRHVEHYRDTLESLHKRGMIRKVQKRGSDGRWVK